MNSSYTISHTDAVLSFLKVGWCSTCWPHPKLCSSPLTGSSVSPQSHWCSIHCLHIDICILKNSSWWLPLSQSSKTKSLILMLLEVLLEGWAPEPDLNLLWQKKKNLVKATRSWYACALSLRHLPQPWEQAQVCLQKIRCHVEKNQATAAEAVLSRSSPGECATNGGCTRESAGNS